MPQQKTEITRGASDPLSVMVAGSPEFKTAHASVQTFVTDAIRKSAATGIVDYHILAEATGNVPPPGLGFPGRQALHIVIGSFQGVNVFLNDFTADATTRTYSAELTYEFYGGCP